MKTILLSNNVRWNGETYSAYKFFYPNQEPGIRLSDEIGDPCGTATIIGGKLDDGEVLIKDYSENDGIFQALIDARVIEDTGEIQPIGHANGHVARLL